MNSTLGSVVPLAMFKAHLGGIVIGVGVVVTAASLDILKYIHEIIENIFLHRFSFSFFLSAFDLSKMKFCRSPMTGKMFSVQEKFFGHYHHHPHLITTFIIITYDRQNAQEAFFEHCHTF